MRKLLAVLMAVVVVVLSFATPALAENTLLSEDIAATYTGNAETGEEDGKVNVSGTTPEDTEEPHIESGEVFLEIDNTGLMVESGEFDGTDEIDYPEADRLNVKAEAAAGEIALSWTKLDEVEGDTLVGYTVYCYPENADYEDGMHQTYTADEAEYTHVFADIAEDMTYNVGVTATYASEHKISYEVRVTPYSAVEEEKAAEDVTLPVTLLIGGVTVTAENMDDVLGDGTVSYDPDTNTLTLNDAEIIVSEGHYGIRNTGTLNICLLGRNKVTCAGTYGIYSTDDVVIDGSGSLEVSGSDVGIRIAGGYEIGGLTLCGDVKVTAAGGNAAVGSSYGVQVDDVLTVCDNAELNVSAGTAPERSCAVYAYDILEIYDNAAVTAVGGDLALDWSTDSVGVRTTHVVIDGGSLTATGGVSGSSNGIFTSTFEMYAGTVTATADATGGQGPSAGLQANKSLKLTSGTIRATGGNAGDELSCGVLTGNGSINISGGDMIAQGGDADYSYGIRATDLVVSSGNVTAYGGKGVWCSNGVSVDNMLTVCGGYVDAKGRTAENLSYGIQASTADITAGEVYASSGSAARSYGLWVFSQLNILCDEIRLNLNSDGFTGTMLTLTAEDGYPFYTLGEAEMDDALTIAEPAGGQFKRTDTNCSIVVGADGQEAQRVVIKPLVYTVTIQGLHTNTTMAKQVPAGWSLNQAYCEALGLEDFSQLLETERDGYTFGRWYTEDGSEFDFGTPITADITIYAEWVEETLPDDPSPDITPAPTPGNTSEEEGKSESNIPNTGDDSLPEIWLGVMITFAAVLFGLRIYKTRNQKDQKA